MTRVYKVFYINKRGYGEVRVNSKSLAKKIRRDYQKAGHANVMIKLLKFR